MVTQHLSRQREILIDSYSDGVEIIADSVQF